MNLNSRIIVENEFMSREKILLVEALNTLKKLNVEKSVTDGIVQRSAYEEGKKLDGLTDELEKLSERYSEESYGYESLQALIIKIKRGAKNALREI